MTKTKKYIFISILLNCIFLFLFFKRYSVAPKTYERSEPYILEIPYLQADSVIRNIKTKYTSYEFQTPINTREMYYADYYDSASTCFYLPEINYVIECITLPMVSPNETHLALTRYIDLNESSDSEYMEWMSINDSNDPNPEENKLVVENFEKEILPKIGKWRHYHNWFLRWLKVR